MEEDDLLGLVGGLHGWEGAQEEMADVGQDGSAAGGDAVLGEEEEEIGEEFIDVGGGGELGESAGEVGGEVSEVAFLLLKLGVAEAEGGGSVENAEAATATRGAAVAAAR